MTKQDEKFLKYIKLLLCRDTNIDCNSVCRLLSIIEHQEKVIQEQNEEIADLLEKVDYF